MRGTPSQIEFPKPTMISVNNAVLKVFETGKQNSGNPIVLCYGFPEHAFSWPYQIPALVGGYHVIVPINVEEVNLSISKS